ncbi:hypothetical protein [Terasakiella sp. SH-1]|uniref:hypothetical protein n=1 Tax=Terasakiella sp. SH-1 TaxID=2560057 RepID=UPI001073BD14|nr:hypothetical protein [Terasakiella sp. SH-1]
MSKYVLTGDDWEHVTPGGNATLMCDTDVKYALHMNTLTIDGVPATIAQMRTHIEEVEFKIKGDSSSRMGTHTIIECTGSEYIDCILKYTDFPLEDDNGIFPIIHALPYMDQVSDGKEVINAEDGAGLGTSDLSKVTIKLKLKAGAFVYTLETRHAVYSGGNQPVGEIIRVLGGELQFTTSGVHNLKEDYLDGMQRGLKALHIASTDIDRFKIRTNRTDIFEMEKAHLPYLADIASYRTSGRVPQAGYTHIDFAGNRPQDIVDTSKWWNTDTNVEGAVSGTVRYVCETLYNPMDFADKK